MNSEWDDIDFGPGNNGDYSATNVNTDTDQFAGNLAGSQANVQAALEVIDDLAIITSAERIKLTSVAASADANVQVDWNQETNTEDDYIKNKPTTISSGQAAAITANTAARHTHVNSTELAAITDEGSGIIISSAERSKLSGIATGAEVNVQSDWDAVSGDALILNKPTIPSALDDLSQDSSYRTVTDAEKSTWNGKADTDVDTTSVDGLMSSEDKTKLDGVLTTQTQSDWNQETNTEVDYIKNKPTTITSGQSAAITANTAAKHTHTNSAELAAITDEGSGIIISAAERSKLSGIAAGAEVNVQSDWDAVSGDTLINNKPTIPSDLSDLSDDSSHRTVTDAEKSTWNGKADTDVATISVDGLMSSEDKTKLDGILTTQSQADWNQETNTEVDYIKNKPTTITSGQSAAITANTAAKHTHTNSTELAAITDEGSGIIISSAERSKLSGIAAGAEVNVQSDWDAISGDALILNKPTVPTLLSELTDDASHRTITDAERISWGAATSDALTSISELTTAADQMIYTTALDTYAVTGLTSAGRAILDDADATAQRVTLGLVIGTDVQGIDAGITSIAGLTTAADEMIYTTALDTYAVTGLTAAGRAILDDASASDQRTTLGLVIGTDVQTQDAGLESISGLTTEADKMIYTTASDTYAVTSLTSAGRAILDDASASDQRVTLGVGTTDSPTFAGITLTNAINEFSTDGTLADDSDSAVPTEKAVKAYADGLFAAVDDAVMGPASSTDEGIARFDSTSGKLIKNSSVTISDAGLIAGATNSNWDAAYSHISSSGADHTYIDQSVVSGSTPTFTGTNFSAIPQSGVTNLTTDLGNKQDSDAGLSSIAGLTTAADKMIYTTASDTYAVIDLTAAGRAILDDSDAEAQRATLGVTIGTNVQAYDAGLASIASLTTAENKMIYTTASDTYAVADLTAAGRAILDDADATAQRVTLGLVIGTDVQAQDAELSAIAGLTSAANKIPMFSGSGTASLLDFKDEDDMSTDSATALCSQQSIKKYVDDNIIAGAVASIFGRSGTVTAQANDYTWAQIDKTTSSIADITTRSHTALTDIGSLTHATIDSYLDQSVKQAGTPTFAQLNADNLRLDGNTLSSTNTNGNIEITPNGSGKTGIGIASPDGTLHVHTATAGTVTANTGADDLVIENNGAGGISIITPNNVSGSLFFGDVDDNDVGGMFYDHVNNLLALKASGGVSILIDEANQIVRPSTTEVYDLGSTTYEWDNLYVQNAVTVSDERIKENIIDISDATTLLKNLKPVQFKYRDTVVPEVPAVLNEKGEVEQEAIPEKTITHTRPHTGFIAQAVKQAMTDSGLEDWSGYAYDENSDTHMIRLNEFIAYLTAGFQELEARITAIEAN